MNFQRCGQPLPQAFQLKECEIAISTLQFPWSWMPTGRLITGQCVLGAFLLTKRLRDLGYWLFCVCVLFFVFSLLEEFTFMGTGVTSVTSSMPLMENSQEKSQQNTCLCRKLYLGKFCHVNNLSNLYLVCDFCPWLWMNHESPCLVL